MEDGDDRGDVGIWAPAPAEALGGLQLYRRMVLDEVSTRDWADVLVGACCDAEAGDDRAREFIRRVLGVADAARSEGAFDVLLGAASHSLLLDEIAQEKALKPGPLDSAERPPKGAGDADPPPATYWAVAFEVVSPHRRRRIIHVALAQAVDGDPRARDWIARVLGSDDDGAFPAVRDEDTAAGELRALWRQIARHERNRSPED